MGHEHAARTLREEFPTLDDRASAGVYQASNPRFCCRLSAAQGGSGGSGGTAYDTENGLLVGWNELNLRYVWYVKDVSVFHEKENPGRKKSSR